MSARSCRERDLAFKKREYEDRKDARQAKTTLDKGRQQLDKNRQDLFHQMGSLLLRHFFFMIGTCFFLKKERQVRQVIRQDKTRLTPICK